MWMGFGRRRRLGGQGVLGRCGVGGVEWGFGKMGFGLKGFSGVWRRMMGYGNGAVPVPVPVLPPLRAQGEEEAG